MSVLPGDAPLPASGVPARADEAEERSAYWPFPIARAIPAAVLAIVITFSADHSARLGLLAFGGFAVASGIVIAVMAWWRLVGTSVRGYFIAQGVVTLLIGIAALVGNGGGLATLFLVVTSWAAITGALELYSGVRTRRRHVASGDWITVGAITMVAALVFVLLPPDIADEFVNADKTTGVVDSSVVAVGLLGAYGAIIVVFLLIAGFSAKWGTKATSVVDQGREDVA